MKGMRSPQSLAQVFLSADPPSMQAQSVKLFGERELEHPAKQGERYIKPSDPHTGSYAASGQEHAALHDEEKGEEESNGEGVGK